MLLLFYRSCDNTFSEFRLRQVEAVALDSNTSVRSLEYSSGNDHSRFNEYGLEKNATEKGAVSASFTTFNDHQQPSTISMMSPSTRNVSHKQKNSLLEIVHNFSDKNDVQNVCTYGGKHSPSPSSSSSLEIIEEDSPSKPSILKKKFDERSFSLDSARPSSILKRNHVTDGGAGTRVPFTSSIGTGIGSGSNLRATKQGILKKHSSLDEQDVRRRSCSPDVDSVLHQECKPILKSQRRRCSLEGFVRNGSPELHSILKRSKIANDDCGDRNSSSSGGGGSGGSPHGILKRKIFASAAATVSSSSSSSSSSWSLSPPPPPPPPPLPPPQLGGTNGSSDSPSSCNNCCDDTVVKPILKNYKQHSFELAVGVLADNFNSDSPRPILKKKHSVETDTDDDKPVKPILKSSRSASFDEDDSATARGAESLVLENEDADLVAVLKSKSAINSYFLENLSIKPILKKKKNSGCGGENNKGMLKSSGSVKSDDDVEAAVAVVSNDYYDKREQNFAKRHSLPGCVHFYLVALI